MKVREQLRELWRQATGSMDVAAGAADANAERKTLALPAILSPVQFPGQSLPKPTPVNLRRFAETPVVRRAINVIKDRVAAMDWQVRVRRGCAPDEGTRLRSQGRRPCAGRSKSRTRSTAFAP